MLGSGPRCWAGTRPLGGASLGRGGAREEPGRWVQGRRRGPGAPWEAGGHPWRFSDPRSAARAPGAPHRQRAAPRGTEKAARPPAAAPPRKAAAREGPARPASRVWEQVREGPPGWAHTGLPQGLRPGQCPLLPSTPRLESRSSGRAGKTRPVHPPLFCKPPGSSPHPPRVC